MKKAVWPLIALFFAFPFLTQSAFGSEILVGIADIDTEPHIGVPLAGYGSPERRLKGFIDWGNKHKHSTFFKPSQGVHTPIRSKVMVVRKDNRNLVFVSIDVVGIEYRFVADIAKHFKKKGFKEDEFFVTGTHTHSGPGTLSRRLPLELVAADLFKKKNYKRMLSKVVQSIELAISRMEPADLYTSSATINGVQRNKFRYKDQEYYNKEAKFLVARSKGTGTWLGGLVNFAVHGGGMPHGLLLYSSDFPGQIEINLEKILAAKNGSTSYKPVFLFMNGAEGDVGVKNDPTLGETVENVEKRGRSFGEQAAPALEISALKPVTPEKISIKRTLVHLGATAGSSLKWCVGGVFKKLPPTLRIPYLKLFPTESFISQVQIGNILMMTWPGEASTSLGWTLQAMGQKEGFDTWFLGLTNDYMTYFTSKEEFNQGAYDSCSSLFTYKGGEKILRAHQEELKRR